MTTPQYAYQIRLLFNIADHKLAQLINMIDEVVVDADMDINFSWFTDAQYVPYQEYTDRKQRSEELLREEEELAAMDFDVDDLIFDELTITTN